MGQPHQERPSRSSNSARTEQTCQHSISVMSDMIIEPISAKITVSAIDPKTFAFRSPSNVRLAGTQSDDHAPNSVGLRPSSIVPPANAQAWIGALGAGSKSNPRSLRPAPR